MAIVTAVNGRITDAATQTNVKMLGDGPAMAIGTIFQSLAHSTGILYETATGSQQQLAIAAPASTSQGVIQIYSVDPMAGAMATSKLAQSDVADNMPALPAALRGSTAKMPTCHEAGISRSRILGLVRRSIGKPGLPSVFVRQWLLLQTWQTGSDPNGANRPLIFIPTKILDRIHLHLLIGIK